MFDAHAFASLSDEQFIVLTTFRPSGEGVPTTVWFAEEDGTIYVTTMAKAKKVKRIRANPHVQLTPSDRVGVTHGATIDAQARVLEAQEFERARAALRRKYPEYDAFTARMDAVAPGTRIFIAITPNE